MEQKSKTMKLCYFAWIRERIGLPEEEVNLPADVDTIEKLFTWLRNRGEEYAGILEQPEIIRVALDQHHAPDIKTSLEGVKEIALFPPMTGG